MADFDKFGKRSSSSTLGGRIGSDQIGMFDFKLAKLDQELVIFSITDEWIIEDMVTIVVKIDLTSQGLESLRNIGIPTRIIAAVRKGKRGITPYPKKLFGNPP